MRRLLAMVAALGTWSSGASAQANDAIGDVISSQLDAFVARDITEAWSHASPNIQRMFGNPGNFGVMVQNGYPMVWDNRDAEFLEHAEIGGQIMQRVLIEDPEGARYICIYAMVETEEGWKINGVQVMPAPELAA